jgi:glyoxylase I family protein
MRDIPNLEASLHAIVITVADIEQSLAFYRDLLGFPLVDQFTHTSSESVGVTHVLDVGNNHRLHLCHYNVPPQPSPWLDDNGQPGIRHIGFQVLDTDATTARLKSANIPFTLDPVDMPIGARIAIF